MNAHVVPIELASLNEADRTQILALAPFAAYRPSDVLADLRTCLRSPDATGAALRSVPDTIRTYAGERLSIAYGIIKSGLLVRLPEPPAALKEEREYRGLLYAWWQQPNDRERYHQLKAYEVADLARRVGEAAIQPAQRNSLRRTA